MKNRYDIAFLHTGQVHIETFQSLIHELAPDLHVYHAVNEHLLLHAQKFGVDKTLYSQTADILLKLSCQSELTVCTCSSIGAIAEQVAQQYHKKIIRIDRPMADKAVQYRHILVLAALESTLEPTRSLLEASAKSTSKPVKIDYQVVKHAWPYFIAGDTRTYNRLIKEVIKKEADHYDVIVLAQASMAGAASAPITQTPILSSPRLGVQAAIKSAI
jgi:hypothetical protein